MSDIERNMTRDQHGVQQSNEITDAVRATRDAIDHKNPVQLSDPQLKRVTRLRLVSDPGHPEWDLSYCYGELQDGTPVRVQLPRGRFFKRALKHDIVEMCKEVKVYAKGLGLLDPDVVSLLT